MTRVYIRDMPKVDVKDIPDLPGYAADSITGRIFSKTTSTIWRTIVPYMNNKGYLCVDLYKDHKRKHYLVHRLIALTFIDNPKGFKEVNHKDEDKTNNAASNLEWCTRAYNCNYGSRADKFRKSFKKFLESHRPPRNKRCYCLQTGEFFDSAEEAAKKFNICSSAIRKSCLYKQLVHGQYRFMYC